MADQASPGPWPASARKAALSPARTGSYQAPERVSRPGRCRGWRSPSSWLGFLVGGLGLVFGPLWWLFWVGVGGGGRRRAAGSGDPHLRRLVLGPRARVRGPVVRRRREECRRPPLGWRNVVAALPCQAPRISPVRRRRPADDAARAGAHRHVTGRRGGARDAAPSSARSSSTPSACSPALTSSWPTPGSAPSRGSGSSGRTGTRASLTAFEYWSHAACVLPIEEWPYYAFRRRALRARGKRWHQSHRGTCAEVLARLRAEGPLTATQLGGAKNGSSWWDWSDTKIAVEWLLDVGDVICVRREGWRRVYDLPDRVLPGDLLAARAHRRRVPGPSRCAQRPGAWAW